MSFRDLYFNIWKFDREKNNTRSIVQTDDVESNNNIKYATDENQNIFDIHFPKSLKGKKLPTIIIIHGGGYVSGLKSDTDAYARLLAQKGFCTINMEYTKCDGPEKKYFTDQIAEIYDLLDFIKNNKNISEHIDVDKIFLAGDSAGAHIASMVANFETNPALKDEKYFNKNHKICGLILVSPFFAPYEFGGLPIKKDYKDIVFGKDRDEVETEKYYILKHLSKQFPPSIMFSFKNDLLVYAHKNIFLKQAKKMNLNLHHYDVLNGYKNTHDIIVKYPDCYKKCIDKIAKFVSSVCDDKFEKGFFKHRLTEEDVKPKVVSKNGVIVELKNEKLKTSKKQKTNLTNDAKLNKSTFKNDVFEK